MKSKLDESSVKNFKVANVFRDYSNVINAIDFSKDGLHLISSSEDDQIVIYNCENGTQSHSFETKKLGVGLIRFTHIKNTAIHSTTKFDDTICYLNLRDNKYIVNFLGHTRRVISLSSSPVDDMFLSGSLDKTLRLWELRTPNCLGKINTLCDGPIGCYDPKGLTFAIGLNSETIKLYDTRLYQKGPFSTLEFQREENCDWTDMKYSRDGKYLLLSTNGSVIRVVDLVYGIPHQYFTGYANNTGIPIEACFSPDAKFVFSGSTDGRVHVWDVENGDESCVLRGIHPGAVLCTQFNPKYNMLVSACTNVAFWLPIEKSISVNWLK